MSKQLTREEALTIINKHWDDIEKTSRDALLSALIDLGVFTPADPNSAEDEAISVLNLNGHRHSLCIVGDLRRAGLKIVKV